MKSYFLFLLVFLSLSFPLWALEIRGVPEKQAAECESGALDFQRCGAVSYYLIGPCEKAAKEIRKMNGSAIPKCECSNSECRTELTPHLPEQMRIVLLRDKYVYFPKAFQFY